MEFIQTPAMDYEPFHECCISKIAKYVWISYHILNTTQMLVYAVRLNSQICMNTTLIMQTPPDDNVLFIKGVNND